MNLLRSPFLSWSLRITHQAFAVMTTVFGLGLSAVSANEPLASERARWSVAKDLSKIEFLASQTGEEFVGQFTDFEVEILFDPERLETSKIIAAISTSSAATGDKQRDKAIPTSDWFASRLFPNATFESHSITRAENGFVAEGVLTIRETTLPILLPFELTIEADHAVARSEITLNRLQFGVGQGEFSTGKWVSSDVRVLIHIEADREL